MRLIGYAGVSTGHDLTLQRGTLAELGVDSEQGPTSTTTALAPAGTDLRQALAAFRPGDALAVTNFDR